MTGEPLPPPTPLPTDTGTVSVPVNSTTPPAESARWTPRVSTGARRMMGIARRISVESGEKYTVVSATVSATGRTTVTRRLSMVRPNDKRSTGWVRTGWRARKARPPCPGALGLSVQVVSAKTSNTAPGQYRGPLGTDSATGDKGGPCRAPNVAPGLGLG